MSRGYPDYYGFSTFPKYGTVREVSVLGTVITPGNTAAIVSLDVKGRTYGGYVWITGTVSSFHVLINFKIDGILFDNEKVSLLRAYNLSGVTNRFVRLLYYDAVAGIFIVGINEDVTFEYEFILSVINGNPIEDVSVNTQLYYTEVR